MDEETRESLRKRPYTLPEEQYSHVRYNTDGEWQPVGEAVAPEHVYYTEWGEKIDGQIEVRRIALV